MILVCVGDSACYIGLRLLILLEEAKVGCNTDERSLFITTNRVLARKIDSYVVRQNGNVDKPRPFIVSCDTKSYKPRGGTPLDFMNFIRDEEFSDANDRRSYFVEHATVDMKGGIVFVKSEESFLGTIRCCITKLFGRATMDPSSPSVCVLTDASDSFALMAVYVSKFCSSQGSFVTTASLSRLQCLHPLGYICYVSTIAGLMKYSDLYIELPRPPQTFIATGKKSDTDSEYVAISLLAIFIQPIGMLPLPMNDLRIATCTHGKYARIVTSTIGMTTGVGVKAVAQCASNLIGKKQAHGMLVTICSDVSERWVSECEMSLKPCIRQSLHGGPFPLTSLCCKKISKHASLNTVCISLFWTNEVTYELNAIVDRVEVMKRSGAYDQVFASGPISLLLDSSCKYLKETAGLLSGRAATMRLHGRK